MAHVNLVCVLHGDYSESVYLNTPIPIPINMGNNVRGSSCISSVLHQTHRRYKRENFSVIRAFVTCDKRCRSDLPSELFLLSSLYLGKSQVSAAFTGNCAG